MPAAPKSEILQGTLDLMVLNTLATLGSLQWITAVWGTSENNRKARFYSITKSGKKQLQAEARNWERIAGVIGRVLRASAQG